MDTPNGPAAAAARSQVGPGAKAPRWLQSTPVRSFALYPVVVIAFEMIRQGGTLRVVPWGIPLLIWGYLQYRLVGRYLGGSVAAGPGSTCRRSVSSMTGRTATRAIRCISA